MNELSDKDAPLVMRAALDAATALARISAHEAECARRYNDMSISIARFQSQMDRFFTMHEAAQGGEMQRRDQRDRDTRQTAAMARIAAMSSLIAGVVAIGLHFLK